MRPPFVTRPASETIPSIQRREAVRDDDRIEE
jgi:hypothetical protein